MLRVSSKRLGLARRALRSKSTTEEFLRRFSVQSLDDLPMLNPEQIEHFKEEAEDEAQLKLDI